ncbi:MAG: type II CAAX endopeptidase family protein [Candidatus Bathyarchaeota archaeon]|nr:type II CAAX endopeptidase family protein [Candidatus Bathyarchaeota archaeon]
MNVKHTPAMKAEVKKAFWLFLVLFLTWQGIYLIASAYPILYDYWLLAYLGVSIAAISFFALDKQKIDELGFKEPKIWKTSGILGLVFAVAYNIYWVVFGAPIFSLGPVRIVSHGIFSIPYNLLFALTVGIVEETTFRGYILRNLNKAYSNIKAVAISSILFGLYHLSLISALTSTTSGLDTFTYWTLVVLAAMIIGVFLGYFYIYTQMTTIGPIVYHSLSIFIESLVPFTLATSQLTGHLFNTTVYILFIPVLILLLKSREMPSQIRSARW